MEFAKPIGHLTKIHKSIDENILSLYFLQGKGMRSSDIEIGLDESMEAVPSEIDAATVFTISLQGPEISKEYKGYRTHENSQLVSFSIPPGYIGKPSTHSISIKFRWRNPFIVPAAIKLKVIVKLWSSVKYREYLEGFNASAPYTLQAQLIEFLKRKAKTDFYFPQEKKEITIPYDNLSPLINKLQDFPNSTVWGTTWPHESYFWRSTDGLLFLAKQLLHYTFNKSSRSKRIAVCPYSMGSTQKIARDFIVDLEVQAMCHVDIKVFSIDKILLHFGDSMSGSRTEALLCLGNNIGFCYQNILSPQETRTSILFDNKGIDFMVQQYHAIQSSGRSWKEYKTQQKISYTKNEIAYIKSRTREVLSTARAIASINLN